MGLNYQIILKIAGVITLIIGIAMIPSLVVSAVYGETGMIRAFGVSLAPMLALGMLLIRLTPSFQSSALRMREGVLVVALCWILASALGTMPYLFSGVMHSFINAFFESVSGFSTTGATLIDDLPAIPRGLLFWRSFTHWLGGMGILVFAISILPAMGIGAQNIAKAETPGPTLDKIATRISDNAKILYTIYLSFSVLELILLLAGGLNLFDAMIHTFGSMGTGGLSNYTHGVADFDSVYVECVVSIFCLLASVNFIAYNDLLQRRWKDFFREPELRIFAGILAAAILMIALSLRLSGTFDSVLTALRHAFFQVASFMSTSGYVSADYSVWPAFSQWILFLLLFVGGCSSSTAGGIKIVRVAVLLKLVWRSFYKRLHPRAVVAVKLGDRPVTAETVSSITAFILTYMLVFLFSAAVLALDNLDLTTTISAAAAMLSNTGIGFGEVGYARTFDVFSSPARLYLSLLMIAGRLELFTILLLLTPSYWFPDRQ